jgi:hypothetical protein
MIRSDIWNPESWGERGKSVMVKQMAKKFDADKELEALIESEIEKNYAEELY